MFQVKALPEFTVWLDALKDRSVRAVIAARLKRLEFGLMGDAKSLGDGLAELRIHVGAGWRVYLAVRNKQVVVLLAGGSKGTQTADIKKAKILLLSLKEERLSNEKED
jgi:putative addiction module killer protein